MASKDAISKEKKISFWDNIFYWTWSFIPKSGYAHRSSGIIAIMQFIYCLLVVSIIINCLEDETAWKLYLMEKAHHICGYLILVLPLLMIVNSLIYNEKRYNQLNATYNQMCSADLKKYRIKYYIFIAITIFALLLTIMLFNRFGESFLLPD